MKFKDADLVGIPLRLTVGSKTLAQGFVELKPRDEKDNKRAELLPVGQAAATVAERVRALLATSHDA